MPADADVLIEEQRVSAKVHQLRRDSGVLGPVCMYALHKIYPRKGGATQGMRDSASRGSPLLFDVAVESLSLNVNHGEVFGLLGHNGAGKSTTMGILSGEVAPTGGHAWLNNKTAQNAALKTRVGYCRQEGGLQEQLTCREHLFFGARVRGIREADIPARVEALLQVLDMAKYGDVRVKHCSGGTQRKVSVAMALLASPPTLLLDEPSSGMDPFARRLLWRTVRARQKHQQREGTGDGAGSQGATVISTHSMSEAESLCDRVGIMVGGRLRCLGTIQQLKRKYAHGFSVHLRTRNQSECVAAVKTFIVSVFHTPGEAPERKGGAGQGTASLGDQDQVVRLVEEYGGQLRFWVPAGLVRLSSFFRSMEGAREGLHIEEYSISPPSLEQVFLILKPLRFTAQPFYKIRFHPTSPLLLPASPVSAEWNAILFV